MSENTKTPRIRFKGFTDAWEQRKLGDVGKAQSGVGFPDKEQGGKIGVPFYKVSDMNNEGNEHEMCNANNYVSEAQCKINGWTPITEISVIFAKVGAAIMLNRKRLVRIPFLLDNNTMAYKFGTEWDIDFGKTLFEQVDLTDLVQIGALPSYNATDVESVEISMPDKPEQHRIGVFFKQLDNLITLHQRKCDKLKNIKAALLEKMFPQGDATTPKIRFKGFTDAWEQRKLGDVAKINMGQSPDGANYTTNPNDAILVQGNADMSDGWVLPRVYTKQITKQAHIGDLIFSVRAPVGEVGKTQYNVVIGRGVAAISGNEFIFQSLKRMNSLGYWTKLAAGSTFESINSDTLKTAEFAIPKENEQTQIGEILLKIDNLITLHQRKVEKLKNIKSALLEKMFV